jgi:hypothetical protein
VVLLLVVDGCFSVAAWWHVLPAPLQSLFPANHCDCHNRTNLTESDPTWWMDLSPGSKRSRKDEEDEDKFEHPRIVLDPALWSALSGGERPPAQAPMSAKKKPKPKR